MEDEHQIAGEIALLVSGMTNEEDIDSVLMRLTALDDTLAIWTLVAIIVGDNPIAAKVAEEFYKFYLGEPYVSQGETQRLINEKILPKELETLVEPENLDI